MAFHISTMNVIFFGIFIFIIYIITYDRSWLTPIHVFESMSQEIEKEESDVSTSEWIVFLTTCVKPSNMNDEAEIDRRKEVYEKQIRKWLDETRLPIFVVESSGYTFSNLKEQFSKNRRFQIYSYKQDDDSVYSSTIGETHSLEYLLSHLQGNHYFQNCKYILKVTGKYFLKDIESQLSSEKIVDSDMYLQKQRDEIQHTQNSEYFGIKKELLPSFLSTIETELMERALYKFSLDHTFKFIGPFPNEEGVKRGDGMILKSL